MKRRVQLYLVYITKILQEMILMPQVNKLPQVTKLV